jgi:archaemetzincin
VIKFLFIPACILLTLSCTRNQTYTGNKPVTIKKFNEVAFLPYDNFDTALLNTAVKEAAAFYHCKTTILPPRPLPAFAFYRPRQRYKADSLIKFQSSIILPGTGSVVGLTYKDISTSLGDKEDWGIFGLGYCPGKACIVSVFRLKSTTYDRYRERFIKVLLHELGHNQGLPHCSFDSTCLMADAKGTIAQVDKEKKWLCDHCKKILSE